MIHDFGTVAAATFNRSFDHDGALFASYRPRRLMRHLHQSCTRSVFLGLPSYLSAPTRRGGVTPGSVAGSRLLPFGPLRE